MTEQEKQELRQFVDAANRSGTINYDYACELTKFGDDHACVTFYSTEEADGYRDYFTGKLRRHSPGLMSWQEDDDQKPIIFSDMPWVLVAIVYAGA